jgi:hypothetical protein
MSCPFFTLQHIVIPQLAGRVIVGIQVSHIFELPPSPTRAEGYCRSSVDRQSPWDALRVLSEVSGTLLLTRCHDNRAPI